MHPKEKNQTPPRPTNVAVDKPQGEVRIDWTDSHQSVYSFEQLRAACPCAECKEYKKDDNPLRQARVVSTELDGAHLVGNYALQLIWDDGHRFGIYTWQYLRSLG